MKLIRIIKNTVLIIFLFVPQLYSQKTGVDIAVSVRKDICIFKQMIDVPRRKVVIKTEKDLTELNLGSDYAADDGWLLISDHSQNTFLKGLMEAKKINQVAEFSKKYVDFFGKGETSFEDMLLSLGCPLLTTGSIGYMLEHADYTEEFKESALFFNKYIVERSLSDKEFYWQIHWHMLWSNLSPFNHASEFDTQMLMMWFQRFDELSKKEKWDRRRFEFWHHLRLKISLVYLCNLEEKLVCDLHLLTNGNPEKFMECVDKIINEGLFMLTNVEFDYDKLKYRVSDTPKLPPFRIPDYPFPNACYFAGKRGFSVEIHVHGKPIPFSDMMSHALIQVFAEDFENRIKKSAIKRMQEDKKQK